MSSSSSNPEATPNRDVPSNITAPDASPDASPEPSSEAAPDYVGLVRFLMQPFLSHPEALKLDCERSRQRVFVRVAIDERDRGRAYGRGGRNIDAIRHVLVACAKVAGEVAHLDIFGDAPKPSDANPGDANPGDANPGDAKPASPKRRVPPPKPRLRRDRPAE